MPTLIVVQFHPDAITNQHLLLRISDTIVRQMGERRVIPQPAASTVVLGGLLYTFPINNSGKQQQVSFSLEPATLGPLQIQVQPQDILGRRAKADSRALTRSVTPFWSATGAFQLWKKTTGPTHAALNQRSNARAFLYRCAELI